MTDLIARGFIRISQIVAVVAIGALTAVAAPPHAPADTGPPAPAPAAQSRLMPAVAPPADLIGRQLAFHVDLAVDFVVTGAQLAERIVAVPGTLVRDIGNGTPVPVTVRDAVLTLADVEFDAGRELVGYARDYAGFQIRFVTELLATLPGPLGELIAAGGALVSEFVERVADFAMGAIDQVQSLLHDVATAGAGPNSERATPALSATAAAPVNDRPTAAAVVRTRRATRPDRTPDTSPGDAVSEPPTNASNTAVEQSLSGITTFSSARGEVRAAVSTETGTGTTGSGAIPTAESTSERVDPAAADAHPDTAPESADNTGPDDPAGDGSTRP